MRMSLTSSCFSDNPGFELFLLNGKATRGSRSRPQPVPSRMLVMEAIGVLESDYVCFFSAAAGSQTVPKPFFLKVEGSFTPHIGGGASNSNPIAIASSFSPHPATGTPPLASIMLSGLDWEVGGGGQVGLLGGRPVRNTLAEG